MSSYKAVHKTLLSWYEREGRHSLPWRLTDDIYHVYLSEIMLQQTQVNRVRDEYYPLFLEKFPTIKHLADADLNEVLSLWSGLGYYRRARNLYLSAKLSKDGLPTSLKELKSLPGVGDYTASAVCSFALHQSVPVVDTNISRVLKRHFGLLGVKDKIIWKYAEKFLNIEQPRAHNLALMDLGSMICTLKSAECEICPLEKNCQGKEEPTLYTQTKKKEYIKMELYFGVLVQENKIALKFSDDNMYKDMLTLPKVDPLEENFLGSFKHAYTKYRLDVNIYKIEEIDGEIVWIDLEEFDSAPISSLTKKAKKFFE